MDQALGTAVFAGMIGVTFLKSFLPRYFLCDLAGARHRQSQQYQAKADNVPILNAEEVQPNCRQGNRDKPIADSDGKEGLDF